MTLNASLSFLQRQHLLISALLGFIFGPLTYYAGSKFGAASLEISFAHISLLALTWMFTLPMMVFMAKKYTQPQGFQ
jgi:hypothetical protein